MHLTDASGLPIEIRLHSSSAVAHGRHNSAICELIEEKALEPEECSGDVQAPMGAYMRFGKRIWFEDNYGFITLQRFPSVAWAKAVYEALNRWYAAWDAEDDTQEVHQQIALAEAYVVYLTQVMNIFGFPESAADWDQFRTDEFRAERYLRYS